MGTLHLVLVALALLVSACKPRDKGVANLALTPTELPGLTISLPPGAPQVQTSTGWFGGRYWARPEAGGQLQLTWRHEPEPIERDALVTAFLRIARSLDPEALITELGETTIAGHRAVTADVSATRLFDGHLAVWYCPEDRRLFQVFAVGPVSRIKDRILGSAACHTWTPERARAAPLDVPRFTPPPGFEPAASDEPGTARWTRGAEGLLTTYGIPASLSSVLAATRERLPKGLRDITEREIGGPNPRIRIEGRRQDEHADWAFSYDILECRERGLVYVTTHFTPRPGAAPGPHPLDAIACP
jgi:hypothetical protein